MPGVVRVFTGEDFNDVGGIPCGWLVTDRFGAPMQEPGTRSLAHGKVRHVGDPDRGRRRRDLRAGPRRRRGHRQVDIEELPAVVDMKAALAAGAPQVHDDLASNLCFDWGFVEENKARGRRGDRAARTTSRRSTSSTTAWSPNPMEPRVAIGEYDAADETHTLWTTSQNPHVIRLLMGAFVLGIPEHKLRVIAPDVGGGFGSKIYHYAEEAFVTYRRQGRRAAGEMDLDAARKPSCPTPTAATT